MRKTPPPRGVALVAILWISAVLTLLMYAFLAEMQVEYALAGGFAAGKKAEQLAWSAIDLGIATVDNLATPAHKLDDLWSHDPDGFFEVPLGEGAFTLVHPVYDDETLKARWGLEDEASKVNINYAPREALLKLPRMTEEIADSIIDWRDQDSNPGPSGAEDQYYQGLDPAYSCKNQPFETLEELMLVRGVTAEVLYGEDANLNGRLEPSEDDGDTKGPRDNADGRLDPGLYAYVTTVSYDTNLTNGGQTRVNLNTANDQQLQQAGFTPDEVMAINFYRVNALRGNPQQPPFPNVAYLLNLMNAKRFREVVDACTVVDGEQIPGLINVNTAPKAVLMVLPGITDEIAVKIMDYRTQPGADLSNIGWLAEVVQPKDLQQFALYVTARSNQFRLHAVGRIGTAYSMATMTEKTEERPGAFRRMIAIYDRLAKPPRLLYWKDATKLGMPYDPEEGPTPATQKMGGR
jgi:type II secretory pathway component PulK